MAGSMLIGDLLDPSVATTPDRLAATLGEQSVSFRELDHRANAMSHALHALGVRRGSIVAWWADTHLRSLEGFLACARLGAVFAPINPKATFPELERILRLLAPDLMVADAGHATSLDASRMMQSQPRSLHYACFEGSPSDVWTDLDLLSPSADGDLSIEPPRHDEPHIAYLTSGTTGEPKAVMVSHRATWLRSSPGGGTYTTAFRGQGIVVTFPLFHYAGWHYIVEAWQNQTTAHLVPRADAHHIVSAVERWRASGLYCIPAVWERILERDENETDFSSLRYADTGTSPVTGDLVGRIRRRFPWATTRIFYGSTEAGRMATLPESDLERKPGSVGRPAFPTTLWVTDEGEVCVQTPAMMDGYLRNPEKTSEVLGSDGTYRSGDLGWIDDEGYLFLTGRKSDAIRSGGETIAPAEVELLLRSIPGVHDAAVVGLPDPTWGEVVCAALVRKDDEADLSLKTVRSHLEDLAPHKHPRVVHEVESIPRTPATGQVQRALLRTQILGE